MIEGISFKEGLTITGLGLMMIGLVGWWFTSVVRQSVRRSAAEGSLDDRGTQMVKTLQESFNKQSAAMDSAYQKLVDMQGTTIEALRLRLEQVQDKLGEAYSSIAKMQTEHHRIMTDTVGEVRRENLESNKRLHDRLDKTEDAHKACEDRLLKQASEINTLSSLIRAPQSGTTVNLPAGSSVSVGPTIS